MKNGTYDNNEANVPHEDVSISRNCNPEPIAPIIEEKCNKCFRIDSSILFFFLILVCIFKNSNCDICQDTLLMFFLLLVVLLNNFGCGCEC